MEERKKRPGGFSDIDKLLVDEEIVNPFEVVHNEEEVYTHPYQTTQSHGYIRYMIEGKKMIVLDCVVVEKKR